MDGTGGADPMGTGGDTDNAGGAGRTGSAGHAGGASGEGSTGSASHTGRTGGASSTGGTTGGTGGYIEREGSLTLVQTEFQPLVAALRDRVADRFDGRLHSAYLYGSVPRGTAQVGRSDLDVLLALHTEPTAADRAEARAVEAELDAEFDVIDGAGILLFGRDMLLSELERHDLGWFVACLCTPLLGADLAEQLPRYGPPRCSPARPMGTSATHWPAGVVAPRRPPAKRGSGRWCGAPRASSSGPRSPWSCPGTAAGPAI